MENLLLIPILAMGAYLLYVYKKYGMTKSISATFQRLQTQNEKLFFIFTLWAVAFPIMIVGILKAPNFFSRLLYFIASGFILVISIAPMYWKSETYNNRRQSFMHFLGSYGGIGVGMIATLFAFTTFPVITLIALYFCFVIVQMVLKWQFVNNYIYWIEVIAIVLSVFLIYVS